MARADELLKEYRAKRDFAKTQEPSGDEKPARKPSAAGRQGIFIVQKHDATRLHYDFRLELDGVLKSWAVTRGPSLNPGDKRLAVRTEDHPMSYARFEGTIPEGQYGGGTVMLWDEGTWEAVGDPHQGLEKGDLKFRLFGKRLKGEWVLVHMKGRDTGRKNGAPRENWLLIKHRDEYADEGELVTDRYLTSVDTGRDLDAIARGLKPRKARASKPQVWTHGKSLAMPEFRPPQLATLVDKVPEGADWLFEMKYDGYRCLAAVAGEEVRLYTRSGKDWTTQFARLREPLSRITKGTALIDGEICAIDERGRTDFSTLKTALSEGGQLVYFAFDLLEHDGEDLRPLPLIERKERLRALLGPNRPDRLIQYSDHIEGNGQAVLEGVCGAGHEGILAKLATAPYSSERSKTWLKVKCAKRQEFVIGGWRPSDKHKGFASLLLGTWEDGKLVYNGRVGTGFTQKDAAELQAALDQRARATPPFETVPRPILRRARWVEPELVAEIAFTEFTPDGVLRHPSFLGLREDKSAKSVVRETPEPTPSAPKQKKPAAKPRVKAAKPVAPPSKDALGITTAGGIAAAEKIGARITSPERVAYPGQGVTKGELVAYYAAVAEAMLPYVAERPLSLVRCPQGRAKYCFFQKHDTGSFPEAMKKVPIVEKDGATQEYFYLDDLAGLIACVQMNVLEFHIWGSRRDDLERPERVIFDIDPDEGLDFDFVRQAALDMRRMLRDWGLETFPMVTGGKGVHVIAPLVPDSAWPEVKAFCKAFAQRLEREEPERFVANMSKAKRKGRMFVDYLRNERGSTAISPYSTRSREGAPVATPLTWQELETVPVANGFSLAEAAARAKGPDPWKGYFSLKQSITAAMVKSATAAK